MKQKNKFIEEQLKNMEPKLLVIFVIDNSSAMTVDRMESVNSFLDSFYKSIQSGNGDPFPMEMIDKIEFSIITYSDSVQTLRKVSLIGEYESTPQIECNRADSTCFIEALHEALDIVNERKEWYKTVGQRYYRPQIYILSADDIAIDTDSKEYTTLRDRIFEEYSHNRLYIINKSVGTQQDNNCSPSLKEICCTTVHTLQDMNMTLNAYNINQFCNANIASKANNTDCISLPEESSWIDKLNI